MITIYTKTLRDAACADVSDEDIAEYAFQAERYMDFLWTEITGMGFEFDSKEYDSGRSYSTDDDEEESYMRSLPDFRTWYQASM